MFTFDWTISVANLLTMGGMIVASLYAFLSLKADVRIVKHDQRMTDTRVEAINANLVVITSILTRVAVQDERLNSFEHRIITSEADIRDMQHGKGFVAEEIKGEYTRHGKVK